MPSPHHGGPSVNPLLVSPPQFLDFSSRNHNIISLVLKSNIPAEIIPKHFCLSLVITSAFYTSDKVSWYLDYANMNQADKRKLIPLRIKSDILR